MVCCVTQPIGKSPECFVREFGEDISDYDIFQDPNHNELIIMYPLFVFFALLM
jgi:hypothetical protein